MNVCRLSAVFLLRGAASEPSRGGRHARLLLHRPGVRRGPQDGPSGHHHSVLHLLRGQGGSETTCARIQLQLIRPWTHPDPGPEPGPEPGPASGSHLSPRRETLIQHSPLSVKHEAPCRQQLLIMFRVQCSVTELKPIKSINQSKEKCKWLTAVDPSVRSCFDGEICELKTFLSENVSLESGRKLTDTWRFLHLYTFDSLKHKENKSKLTQHKSDVITWYSTRDVSWRLLTLQLQFLLKKFQSENQTEIVLTK